MGGRPVAQAFMTYATSTEAQDALRMLRGTVEAHIGPGPFRDVI